MTIRPWILAGLTGSLACAATPRELQLLPEPTFVDVEVALAPPPADPYAYQPADPPQIYAADAPIRDVVYTEPGELPQLLSGGVALPLRHTDVRAHLRGNAAEVVVRQRFVNAGEAALLAVYTFPLPENSAVTDMRMLVGDRKIVSEIREREQARQEFAAAQVAGHTAALLEQERPNVFTQSIANLPAGETVEVELRYTQTLSYDAGEYEFVFPTVVGPRYVPGTSLARRGGSGTQTDTDRVPDASRISPPVLGHGQRSGHDIAIEVIAEAGSPITRWAAPAHAIDVLPAGDRLHVKLARRDELANRDFVLRYRSAAPQPTARLFLDPAGRKGGHFMLVVEPPRIDLDALVGQRELIFVIDVSGSMQGAPIALAQATVREALRGMRPVDTFDVLVFSGASARLFGAPRPASTANLQQALEFIDRLEAGGGTEMADAVRDALLSPVEPGRHRYVSFFTDGYTGEEQTIATGARALVDLQRRSGRRARVFGVGIGSSPNTELISALSQAGDGLPQYIRGPSDIGPVINNIRHKIDAPVFADLRVDWGGFAVDQVYPEVTPDLFASQPLVLHGRYSGAAPTRVRLHGELGGREIGVPVAVSAVDEREDVLGPLWARARVDALELVGRSTTDAEQQRHTRDQIRTLGLQHHIVTAYTSLVAVDRSRVITGPQVSVIQPVEPVDGMTSLVADGVARSIPVGGTTRDFTAVIDLSPTASRDAAGIRLAGTSGAESIDAPSLDILESGVTRMPAPLQQLERDERATRPGPAIERIPVAHHARARLRGLRATLGDVDLPPLRTVIETQLDDLAHCFVTAPRSTYRVRRKLRVTVLLGADGYISGLGLRGPGTGHERLQQCLRDRLEPMMFQVNATSALINIDLVVSMQY